MDTVIRAESADRMTSNMPDTEEGAKSALSAFQASQTPAGADAAETRALAVQEQKSKRVLYGGQAVIEGVMIRGRTQAALAVRRPDGTISLRTLPLETWANGRAREFPLVRGVLVLLETLMVGMKSLAISAEEAAPEDHASKPDGMAGSAATTAGMAVVLAVALALGIALFFVLPLFVSRLAEPAGDIWANLAEGLLRLAIFLGYIWAIGRMKEIRRVFGYHGAEHMAVSAFEHGQPLTVQSLKEFPTAHPRCGTSFLLTVVLVSVIVFMFVPRDPFWVTLLSRVILIPAIAALSYEFIRYSGTHLENVWVRVMTWPNLLMQGLTTLQPDEQMLEVAIEAMNYAIALDEGKAGRGPKQAGPAGQRA